MPRTAGIGTDTMTASALPQSETFASVPMSTDVTRWPSPSSSSLSHLPMRPSPPMTAMLMGRTAEPISAAWRSTDSLISSLHTRSATSGSMPRSSAMALYLETTTSSRGASLTGMPASILCSPMRLAMSRRSARRSIMRRSASLIRSLRASIPASIISHPARMTVL